MRAASVAVLAATLALIVACSATPVAALLQHPLRLGRSNRRSQPKAVRPAGFDAVGNATLQWQFNPSWIYEYTIDTVRRSALEPDAVLVYVPMPSASPTGGGRLFALNATTGKQQWLAHFVRLQAPESCLELIETPTTVACLGTTHFGVAERHTGTVVASGQYLTGYQMLSSPTYVRTLGQRVALMLQGSQINTVQAMVLDAVTGALTSMGTVTAKHSRAVNVAGVGSAGGQRRGSAGVDGCALGVRLLAAGGVVQRLHDKVFDHWQRVDRGADAAQLLLVDYRLPPE